MASNPRVRCENCKWWDRLGADIEGLCRRRAPVTIAGQAYPTIAFDREVMNRDDAIFPCTWISDWCGEFEEREDGQG
jgi:hypothetical protein